MYCILISSGSMASSSLVLDAFLLKRVPKEVTTTLYKKHQPRPFSLYRDCRFDVYVDIH